MSEQPTPIWRSVDSLPFAHGGPPVSGRLRAEPEDFVVEEELGFEPDGDGEHALLRVRKCCINTERTAQALASFVGKPTRDVGYAGLKDRFAVTTQWFTVHLPGQAVDWSGFSADGIEILEQHRHLKKLRRGVLERNRFELRIRELDGDRDALETLLNRLTNDAVPNYFGSQRFGNGDSNLHNVDALFRGQGRRVKRHLRGLWISAARSQLFNEVLALRIEDGTWGRAVPGESLQLAGSRSRFLSEEPDAEIARRVAAFDVEPTGPLFGTGEALTAGPLAELERGVAERFGHWIDGLAREGLRQERRALRLRPEGLEWDFKGEDALVLRFALPSGAYATSVMRELVQS